MQRSFSVRHAPASVLLPRSAHRANTATTMPLTPDQTTEPPAKRLCAPMRARHRTGLTQGRELFEDQRRARASTPPPDATRRQTLAETRAEALDIHRARRSRA